MALRVRSALAEGFPRAFRRNGLILIGTYLLMSLLQGGLVWMIVTIALPLGDLSAPASTGQTPNPGTRLPPLISAGTIPIAMFTGGVLTMPVQVVAIRALVSQFTDRIPEEFVFHRLGWATINSFVGSLMVSIAVGLLTSVLFGLAGWGLFIVVDQAMLGYLIGTWPGRMLLIGAALVLLPPGAFVGVCLLFVGQEIAVRDKNIIGAVAGSWRLTRHNRLRLFILALFPFVVQFIISIVLFQFMSPISAQIFSIGELSIFHITVMAVMARAYEQVNEGKISPAYLNTGRRNTVSSGKKS